MDAIKILYYLESSEVCTTSNESTQAKITLTDYTWTRNPNPSYVKYMIVMQWNTHKAFLQ